MQTCSTSGLQALICETLVGTCCVLFSAMQHAMRYAHLYRMLECSPIVALWADSNASDTAVSVEASCIVAADNDCSTVSPKEAESGQQPGQWLPAVDGSTFQRMLIQKPSKAARTHTCTPCERWLPQQLWSHQRDTVYSCLLCLSLLSTRPGGKARLGPGFSGRTQVARLHTVSKATQARSWRVAAGLCEL